jgi:putative redox protein
VKVVARRLEGFAHEIEIEGKHTLVVDEPPELGGTGTGPSPGRLLAASLASCTAVTIEMYAERKGWEIGALEVEVDATYEGDHVPKAYEVVIRLPAGLDDERRRRLLKVGEKCPVHKLLSGEASVAISDRLEDLG